MKPASEFIASLLARLPAPALERTITRALSMKAARMDPAAALRMVFRIENSTYPLLGALSVKYGGGLHTKHRHTRYHDFFCRNIPRGASVLDVGCGNGELSAVIAHRCDAVIVGIDIDEGNIAAAAKNHPVSNLTFICGDATRGLPPGKFDVVVLSNVIEHVEHPGNLLGLIRTSASPSLLLVRTPVFERDWKVPLKKELGLNWMLDPTHFSEFTSDELAQLLDASGFTVRNSTCRWGEAWVEAVPAAGRHP